MEQWAEGWAEGGLRRRTPSLLCCSVPLVSWLDMLGSSLWAVRGALVSRGLASLTPHFRQARGSNEKAGATTRLRPRLLTLRSITLPSLPRPGRVESQARVVRVPRTSRVESGRVQGSREAPPRARCLPCLSFIFDNEIRAKFKRVA